LAVLAPIEGVKAVHGINKQLVHGVNKASVGVYSFFNPQFLEEKIATLSTRIATVAALRSNRTKSDWHTKRALFYLLQNQFVKCEEDLNKALEYDDKNFVAMYYLACLFVRKSITPNYVEISALLEKAAEATETRGEVSALKQLLHSAEDTLSSIHDDMIGAKGNFHNILHANAVARYFNPELASHVKTYAKNNTKSVKYLAKMLSTPITLKTISSLRANVYCSMNDYSKALQMFEQCLALENESSDDKKQKKNQEKEEAKGAVFYYFNMAVCYLYLREYEKSAQHFLKVTQADNSDDKCYLTAKRVQEKAHSYLVFLKYYCPETVQPYLVNHTAPDQQPSELIPFRFFGDNLLAHTVTFLTTKQRETLMLSNKEIASMVLQNKDYIIELQKASRLRAASKNNSQL